jgi:uncharacterized Zn-finger protein
MSDDTETTGDLGGIRCPWCGVLNRGVWEIGIAEDGESIEVDCEWCDRVYVLTTSISVTFTARRMEVSDE